MSELRSALAQMLKEPGLPDEELQRHLLEILLPPSGPRKMTYEEFLEWADEDTLAEWVDGEVVMSTPASNIHQDLSGFLESVMRSFVEAHHLGIVRSAPFQMKLERSGREPDLIFVANEHLERLKSTRLDGPADLVVEILSPESAARDRGEKFYEYEQAGIPEYWLIDPQAGRAEFYQLDAGGHYQTVGPEAGGVYHSTSLPGFWLRVGWLWQTPLPAVDEVLLEVGGEACARRWIELLRGRGLLPS